MKAAAKEIVVVLCALAALLAATPGKAPQDQLSGLWQRDDSRGVRSYWMGEYPEMTLEISVEGDTVHVRQALGTVRDGVTQQGSGETFLEYSLILDGRPHEVAAPGSARRVATASWLAGALQVSSTLTLSGGLEVATTEVWRLIDGGSALQIERTAQIPDRDTRRATTVFARLR